MKPNLANDDDDTTAQLHNCSPHLTEGIGRGLRGFHIHFYLALSTTQHPTFRRQNVVACLNIWIITNKDTTFKLYYFDWGFLVSHFESRSLWFWQKSEFQDFREVLGTMSISFLGNVPDSLLEYLLALPTYCTYWQYLLVLHTCNTYLQCLLALPTCSTYLQYLIALPTWNTHLQYLLALPTCSS